MSTFFRAQGHRIGGVGTIKEENFDRHTNPPPQIKEVWFLLGDCRWGGPGSMEWVQSGTAMFSDLDRHFTFVVVQHSC